MDATRRKRQRCKQKVMKKVVLVIKRRLFWLSNLSWQRWAQRCPSENKRQNCPGDFESLDLIIRGLANAEQGITVGKLIRVKLGPGCNFQVGPTGELRTIYRKRRTVCEYNRGDEHASRTKALGINSSPKSSDQRSHRDHN